MIFAYVWNPTALFVAQGGMWLVFVGGIICWGLAMLEAGCRDAWKPEGFVPDPKVPRRIWTFRIVGALLMVASLAALVYLEVQSHNQSLPSPTAQRRA